MSEKNIKYVQCTLGCDNRRYTCWLPKIRATSGRKLLIDGLEGEWTVLQISDVELDGEYLNERSQDYKKQRKASDV